MKLSVAFSALFVALINSGADARPLYPFEEKEIATIVKATLRDPDSVKFTWPDIGETKIYSDGDQTAYCFAMNAKNGFGGYQGPQPIIVTVTFGKGLVTKVESPMNFTSVQGNDAVLQVFRKFCKLYGVPTP